MYPSGFKFAEEAYRDAKEKPFGYLFVDLKPQQDERYRLRTNIFPVEMQYVYVRKWIHSYELENAAWLSKSQLAVACRLSQRAANFQAGRRRTTKRQPDCCKLHTLLPQPGPHHSGGSSRHVQSAIRILRPPRNSLSCRQLRSKSPWDFHYILNEECNRLNSF